MLNVHEVLKTFNQGTVNQKIALNKVSLELLPNDFVTVIGSNGAGKSTLLNAIAGNFMVDSGEISIEGIRITRLPAHKRADLISRVFQDPLSGTAASMTIEENLIMAFRRGKGRRLRRAIGTKERDLFRIELEKLGLGLENRLTNKVSLLSGGQRQALTLLMATLQKPKLLLLDEHTAALDPKTAEKVLELTCGVTEQQQLTTLMITHNLDHALTFGNRTIMMHEGRVILDIKGIERSNMTISRLLEMFEKASGSHMNTDRMILA
ncbi:ATP-binding cassette domain-containing protein [Desulfosporosinus sp.]|uniref:ABC transporter ATP-binding protein n=1 Tax=Desulfosporosinus sp. TaxID=157907 RepID=UPI00230C38AD|nr:ATP-binding cassette domain-containing protein [Desulfosporosinus sp.]MCO5388255.1 ATP-binding cassette domain-containing protein [Desulfosporosinus sp.]MDA8223684.1 ATP-binding cassette domain-containing protein [Desulfitobacterium hafniense]